MPDYMVEIPVEELIAPMVGTEMPVLRFPVNTLEGMIDLSADISVESFVKEKIVERLVMRNSSGTEIEEIIEGILELQGSAETPIIRMSISDGSLAMIPLGTKPPWPGDTMHLIDFDEEYGKDMVFQMEKGILLVGINSFRHVLLGSIADAALGYNSLAVIEYLDKSLHEDLLN